MSADSESSSRLASRASGHRRENASSIAGIECFNAWIKATRIA